MLRALLIVSLVVASAFLANPIRAEGEQEKKKPDGQPAPAPKFVPPPPTPVPVPPPIVIVPSYQRSDTLEVWQHYGVNSAGRFVPRVIRTPYGDYYSRNLEPYPWANLRPREWR
jgi:hypothetical protein